MTVAEEDVTGTSGQLVNGLHEQDEVEKRRCVRLWCVEGDYVKPFNPRKHGTTSHTDDVFDQFCKIVLTTAQKSYPVLGEVLACRPR
jgi:hypothetical protein